jgi:hypothetical protein
MRFIGTLHCLHWGTHERLTVSAMVICRQAWSMYTKLRTFAQAVARLLPEAPNRCRPHLGPLVRW